MHATKHNADLEDEKYLIKSCVSEINQYLMRLVETRDSLLTVSKDNVASISGKDKGKCILEDDANENLKITEEERIAMDKRDKELDDLQVL
ncbi:unnamed protein product [Lactuca saligna]|uniref:Uncharacterized protein n=1 Tax=Lactuca saligna TaxID=75948 RepID=A0AA35ZL38_LACSI|nr:unnamed protein product [Lactuca saligna]